MLEVDGSIGGGSILRIAVPVAIATNQELRIFNIRKSRSTPGLRQQHLKGIELLAELTVSELVGAKVGSVDLKVIPGNSKKRQAKLEIPTAGAVSLVLQLLSNYCVMANHSVSIEFTGGGTHTQWSPNFDYLEQVTAPALQLFGQHIDLKVGQLGYYPKGGAEGSFEINQSRTNDKVELDIIEGRPKLEIISRATTNLESAKVAERQLQGLANSGVAVDHVQTYYDKAKSTGTSITAWMVNENSFRGFSALGKKGVKAEDIGKLVADQLINLSSPAAVDEYLADQLMLPLTQTPPGSYFTIPKLTNHVTSNLELINTMLDTTLNLQDHRSYYLIQKI